jgi:hypothetical protein
MTIFLAEPIMSKTTKTPKTIPNLSYRQFPKECVISNIRRGKANRSHIVYANLRNKDGTLIISATLDYITKELERGVFV